MLLMNDQEAAKLGLLVLYAEDQYLADRLSLAPAPDPRLSPNWLIQGYLTASDAVYRRRRTMTEGEPTCYGYLAQDMAHPSVFAAAIRGTDGIIEWIEDAEFLPTLHPSGGLVESGFWDIYASMEYRPAAGQPLGAAQGLAAAVESGELIVLGHSLGSALATYLTFDLAAPALLGDRVQSVLFASPRPGNADFAKTFDQRVKAYQLYNYELDVVPRVPRGVDYTDLPRVKWIGIQAAMAKISFDLACHHHLVCYLSMLNYSLLDWRKLPTIDQSCATCIKGPA